MSIETFKVKAKAFGCLVGKAFLAVFLAHVAILLIYSYWEGEWKVFHGLNVADWGFWGRFISTFPYLVLPVGFAVRSLWRPNKTKIKKENGTSQAEPIEGEVVDE